MKSVPPDDISLIDQDETLVALEEGRYDVEANTRPSCLSSILPLARDGAGRWAVDPLFVDQDGIPTLIEVKRKHGHASAS